MNDRTMQQRNVLTAFARAIWQTNIKDLPIMDVDEIMALDWDIQSTSILVHHISNADDDYLKDGIESMCKMAMFFKEMSDGMGKLEYMKDMGYISGATISIKSGHLPLADIQFNFPSSRALGMNVEEHAILMRTVFIAFVHHALDDEWTRLQDSMAASLIRERAVDTVSGSSLEDTLTRTWN